MATATNTNTSNNSPYDEDDKPSTTTVAPAATAAAAPAIQHSTTDAAPAIAQHSTTDTANNNNNNNNSYDYQESSLTSCPPLFQLQIYGLCCPFLISEEEHDARIGVINLHNYPIIWYRKKLIRDVARDVLKSTAHVIPPARGLIDGMIGQLFASSDAAGGDDTSIPMSYIGIPSTITIVDTDTHGPVIQIRSLDGWDENDPC